MTGPASKRRHPGEDASGCPFQELHLIETSAVNGQTLVSGEAGSESSVGCQGVRFCIERLLAGDGAG